MTIPLNTVPVTSLKGVGSAVADNLSRIGIHSVQDLLFHIPLRYQDRTQIAPIVSLKLNADVVIQGRVISSQIVIGRRRSLLCRISDGTGAINLRFYHFSSAQKKNLQPGVEIQCFGEPRRGATGLEIYHPECRVVSSDKSPHMEKTLTPIYPGTEGLTQQRLRNLCEQALKLLARPDSLQELLPLQIRQKYQLQPLTDAIRFLHQPPSSESAILLDSGRHPAQRRLAFEELMTHNLSLQRLREKVRKLGGFSMTKKKQLSNKLLELLPFSLTPAQQRVVNEVSEDMAKDQPMLRLIQGDVGSGKTIVAALASLQAVENGFQVAIMAPTEILAEQHRATFSNWLTPLGLPLSFVSGKTKGKKRQSVINQISSGDVVAVIGTHALFQDDIDFKKLGLAIIDEQHRFGVHQRQALRKKGEKNGRLPDQLIMTATPIPRTLAMSTYADLDVSVIDELPPGRSPVKTVVIGDDRRAQVMERLRSACLGGRQAYWVCTLIDESEVLECQAAEVAAKQLQELLPELSIGLVHGRMKASEKTLVMDAFKSGHLHLLVSTTVIEVGVDVPNASLMIIENPERLGLAQLHQLRGRVGRGSTDSYCLLMYHAPLSRQGCERLHVMRESSDGFVIAEKDLELRGPGEVLGIRQTGLAQFKVADLVRDRDLLKRVPEAAKMLLEQTPENVEALIHRWLVNEVDYGNV